MFNFFRESVQFSSKGNTSASEVSFDHLQNEEEEILSSYSHSERIEIKNRLHALKGMVDMISADRNIKVFLNHPGGGWFWDPNNNYIRIDAEGILKRSLEENRFFVAHEAAHRRLTTPYLIPKKLQKTPGYHALFNILEDGRINLWLKEKYPAALTSGMTAFYDSMNFDQVQQELLQHKTKGTYVALAHNEMLRLWHLYAQGKECVPTVGLPGPVKTFIRQALPYLKQVWQSYPAPGSENKSIQVVEKSSQKAITIISNKIWPLFKKLLEEEKQKKANQEAQDKKQNKSEGSSGPQSSSGGSSDTEKNDPSSDDKKKETSSEKKKKRKKGTGEGKKSKNGGKGSGDSEGGDNTSDAFDELSKEEQEELLDEAAREIEEELNDVAEEHEGKMGTRDQKTSQKKVEGEGKDSEEKETKKEDKKTKPRHPKKPSKNKTSSTRVEGVGAGTTKLGWVSFEDVARRAENSTRYESIAKEVQPIVRELITLLEHIFIKRRQRGEDGGHREGDDIDVDRVIDEKSSTPPGTQHPGEAPVWTRKYTKEDGPRDYAFSLVLDVSGSMHMGGLMKEAIKGLVIIAETLAHFGIDLEIIGFGAHVYEAKPFDVVLDRKSKETIGYLGSISDQSTLMGRAIKDSAERIAERPAKQKTMIVITDGVPGDDVRSAIKKAEEDGVKVIGVGLGRGTDEVRHHFDKSIVNVQANHFAATLAALIHEVINIDKS